MLAFFQSLAKNQNTMAEKTNTRETDALKRKIFEQEKELDKLKGKSLKEVIKSDDAFEGYSGQYKDIRTGEVVALKVVESAQVRFLRTHLVKGENTSGDYTAADFKKLFDRL